MPATSGSMLSEHWDGTAADAAVAAMHHSRARARSAAAQAKQAATAGATPRLGGR
jgi:hypothetical protein